MLTLLIDGGVHLPESGTEPMSWRELLTCTFDGPRFEDGGLDLRDLNVLVALDALLVDAAQELWRQDNPDRERMPSGKDALLRLRFFGLGRNCTTVTIFRVAEQVAGKDGSLYLPMLQPEPDDRDVSSKLDLAAEVVVEAFRAISQREPLPSRFPNRSLPLLRSFHDSIPLEYQLGLAILQTQGEPPKLAPRLGETPHPSSPEYSPVHSHTDQGRPEAPTRPENLPIPIARGPTGVGATWADAARQSSSSTMPTREPPAGPDVLPARPQHTPGPLPPARPAAPTPRVAATIAASQRDQFTDYMPKPYEDDVDLIGEVTAASLKGKASIRVAERGDIQIEFSPGQEKLVTRALHEHESRRLRVIGRGVFEPFRGKLTTVSRVDRISILDGDDIPFDESAPPIWQLAGELTADIPEEERRRLPIDLARNLDSYLYGLPKKPRGQS